MDEGGEAVSLALPPPGSDGLLAGEPALVVDTEPPEVESVSSPNGTGSHRAGRSIAVNVTFSEDAVVTGTPRIALDTGRAGAHATYHSGSGTPSLLFAYEIVAGDSSDDLNYTGSSALALNGGSITDRAGNDADLDLSGLASAATLAGSSDLVIDTAAPSVSSVTSAAANGTYGIGDQINIAVAFDEAEVTVDEAGGTPYLTLETGETDRSAGYVSGSGSTELLFRYTVAEGDESADLDYAGASALALNGGTITDGAGNAATASSLDLSGLTGASTLAGSKSLVVDGKRPAVSSVTSPDPNDTYGIGATINVTVAFDEAEVTVDEAGGTPYLTLETGETDRSAGYVSGSGSTELLFRYTVAEGDESADLDYAGASALALNGGTITDGAGNAATASSLDLSGLTGASTLAGSKSLVVDGKRPAVSSVTSPDPNDTYGIGATINVTVAFDEAEVTVDEAGGTPYLTLETGETDRNAGYVSGTGTPALVFQYTVAENDTAARLDYAGSSALALNGGSITDGAGNAATASSLDLSGLTGASTLAGSKSLAVDGVPPRVLSVSSLNSSGEYSAGDTIIIRVAFDDAVVVDTLRGWPTLLLETGRPGSHATYRSGTGTAELLFRYIVAPVDEAEDLDYASGSALVLNGGTVRDAPAGNDADLGLPPPGSDGLLPPGLGEIAVVHVAPPLIPQDSADTGDAGYLLGAARGIDAFRTEGRTYAVVAAFGNDTVQLVRVHDNGTLSPAGNATDTGDLSLDNPAAIDAFRIGGDAFAVAATEPDGVQLIRVHGSNGTLRPEGRLADTGGATAAGLKLLNASDVAAFGMGNATYALVSTHSDGGGNGSLQLVRVRGHNATLYANASMSVSDGDPGFERLESPYGVAAFGMGDATYALVTSTHGDSGVQLVRVRGNATLAAVSSATDAPDGSGGFDALGGPRGVDVFVMGGATYAMVASETDDAVQLIRVSPNGTLVAAGSAFNGTRGFGALGGAHDVSVFNGTGGEAYAIVASRDADAVQLIHVHPDGHLLPAGSASEGTRGAAGTAAFDELEGARSVASFDLGGRSYAAVASGADNGVQLIRMSPATATGASTETPSGTYGPGAEIGITVAFNGNVTVAGAPELRLNSGAAADYRSGSGSRMLEFLYEVGAGDHADMLDYDGRFALYGSGGTIAEEGIGVAAYLALPAPGDPGSLSGAREIRIDGIEPRVVSVAPASPGGAYGRGERIEIAVTFTEPVSYSGDGPVLSLNVSGDAAPAAYARGNGTAALTFAYTVREGDMPAGLAYHGRGALSGSLADAAGNAADLSLPAPGARGSLSYTSASAAAAAIVVDGVAPRVAFVAPAAPDGAYREGGRIEIAVAFGEPVSYSGAPPELQLNVSGAPAPAAYYTGNNSNTLTFAYTVQAGDASDKLAYWNTTALSGSLADAAGNAADLALPAPGSAGSLSGAGAIAIDTDAPRAVRVAAQGAPDGAYGRGERIEIAVDFTEPVSYSGARPELQLNVSGTARAAAYESGNGTATLVFAYTVGTGDMSDGLDYWSTSALSGSLADAAGNAANLALPAPGSPGSLSASAAIAVDGTAPRAGGAAPATADAAFTGPNAVRIEYSAPLGPPAGLEGRPVYGAVTVEGSGGGSGEAAPASVSGLGTAVHTVRFGGDGVTAGQGGAIALVADLEGEAPDGTPRAFTDDSIAVRPGEEARTLRPAGPAPVVAIERDGFVREVDVSGGGDSVRPAIDVARLAAGGGGAGSTMTIPAGGLRITAPFAEVSFPPGATASPVPADGLIRMHVHDRPPGAARVAAALGIVADGIELRRTVEVGGGAERIAFDMPVRILLAGQAGGAAFYADAAGGIAPIGAVCAADDAAAVRAQLGGSGECSLDLVGGDKAVYTYHLTGFGTAGGRTVLEAMVANATPGSTVRVPPGTYASGVLEIDKPLAIEPADPDSPPLLTGQARVVVRPPADGPVSVRGLAFEGTARPPPGGGSGGGEWPAASIAVMPERGAPPGGPVVIEGNTFRGTCVTAVAAAAAGPGAPPVAGLAVKNNMFYGIGVGAGCAPGPADAVAAGAAAPPPPPGAGAAPAAAPAQLAGATVEGNYIFGTTNTGISIAGADGLLVKGNHIEGVPDDGMRIMQSRNVQVHLNTVLGANQAPRDAGAPHDGSAGAAIEVWSGSDNVAVTLNRISESVGALFVCAGTCDPGPGAANGTGSGAAAAAVPVPVAAVPVNSADGSASRIRFSHNVLAGSNTGILVANAAGGELDARANYYPGYAESAAGRVSPAGAVLHEPALNGAGPVRIGAVVADAPPSPVRSVDAAVRAAFELGVRDFNAAQARDGGTVGLEPAVHAVDSPGYAADARAAHASAVSALLDGSSADARMLPVLHNSISSAMSLYDASGDAGLAAISAMGASHAHYPFVVDGASGAIVAHGADASLVGDAEAARALAGGADPAASGLLDFAAGSAAAAAAAGTGVAPGHPGAPWKWWAHGSADPAAGGAVPKRSVIALHPGPDGELRTGDDLAFGAGYHPGPGAAHLVVAAGDAAAAAAAAAAQGAGIVSVSPASTASQLAARDALFRLAPPDSKLAGVVVAQALADRQGAAPVTIVALNDSASLQSMSLAGELYEIDLQGALPDGADRVAVVSYNSSSPMPPPPAGAGAGWAAAAAAAIRAAASESQGAAAAAAVVYSGRAGAFAALADALEAQPLPGARWYSTGDLARAELAASGPAASALARSGQLAAVLQHAVPNAAIDAALAAPGAGIVLDESTRGPAYAAYDAPALLGRAMASTPGVPGAPAAVARAIDEDIARTHDGALGSPLILDRNGDLVLPIAYAVSAFPPAAAADPAGAWGQLDGRIGERSCGIALAKGALDFGILSLGRYSRPDTQTVINTGTLPYRSVTLDPGDWTYASGQTLPASITELRELGRAAAYAGAASGFVVAPGLEPGQDRNVQFRINLTAYQSLPPARRRRRSTT